MTGPQYAAVGVDVVPATMSPAAIKRSPAATMRRDPTLRANTAPSGVKIAATIAKGSV